MLFVGCTNKFSPSCFRFSVYYNILCRFFHVEATLIYWIWDSTYAIGPYRDHAHGTT